MKVELQKAPKKSAMSLNALNIAEKPSVAKSISFTFCSSAKNIKSRHPTYVFPYSSYNMTFTSVLGHLFTLDFGNAPWSVDPFILFSAPIIQKPMHPNLLSHIKQQLHSKDLVIIWTDCDREGENIADQIQKFIKEQNQTIPIHRARFSSIDSATLNYAISNLTIINQNESNAVNTRQELDLRIGAAFTRFQTLAINSKSVISYGPCQIPTLGLVVERGNHIKNFVPENQQEILIKIENNSSNKKSEYLFSWKKNNIYDKSFSKLIYKYFLKYPFIIQNTISTPKTRLRPLPTRTVDMIKALTSYLKLPSHKIMEMAESMYTRGYISYPRTETDSFPSNFNYKEILSELECEGEYKNYICKTFCQDNNSKIKYAIGNTAKNYSFKYPRPGKNSDMAHLPIYPLKGSNGLSGSEKAIYDFISRRFLACISENATGTEKIIYGKVDEEIFTCRGLEVLTRGYLDIYKYENWESNIKEEIKEGTQYILFGNESNNHSEVINIIIKNKTSQKKAELILRKSLTKPPDYLTEAELISLMDKNGIGTDATIHEHIKKIITRLYAKKFNNKIIPLDLGNRLIQFYEEMKLSVGKCHLRSEMEKKLVKICKGEIRDSDVLKEEIEKHIKIYKILENGKDKFKSIINNFNSNNKDDGDDNDSGSGYGKEIENKNDFSYFNRNNENTTNNGSKENYNVNFKNRNEKTRLSNFNNENEKNTKKYLNIRDNNDDKNEVLCHCGIICKISKVKKGKNVDKDFFSCEKWPNGCDFFQWCDDKSDETKRKKVQKNSYQQKYSSNSKNTEYTNTHKSKTDVLCHCGYETKSVKAKTKQNSGREFLCCKKLHKPCKFFAWKDEL
ncbi:DNA topoisomerase 3 [Hamiltosporidium tvaerminnensis]|uniref:DNA topoisomerase n=1 Tax=Hamiltosporidium tvaerminnensis TaxID=1176355 RepID=A0A4Q9LXH1_9MICR|nr:DNA topoisomerase 3 [Hamiltosporidium tvaerminnensis]